MKKLFFTLVSVAALAACSKTDPTTTMQEPKQGEAAVVTLSLVGTDLNTKGINALPTQAADNTINTYTVCIFNSTTKILDRMQTATPLDVSSKTMTVKATAGTRDIYVVANTKAATDLNAVITVDDLKAVVSDLKYENEGNFTMIGKKLNQTLAPSTTGTTNLITVPISRLVARITLKNITTGFTGGLSTKDFVVDSVYILNAVGTKSHADSSIIMSPAVFYNRSVSTPAFAFPQIDLLSATVNNTTQLIVDKPNGLHYYSYANPATTFAGATKLVVTGKLNGIRTYYPVAVNVAGNYYDPATAPVTPGIFANNQYEINMVIKGYGSNDPNTPVLPGVCIITVVPLNWVTVINQNVEF